jgi:hypothetical protein
MDYFGLLLLQVKLIDTVEGVIYLSSTVLSLLLLALSISAYRNTGIKKIAYAIAAFALFATFLFYEYLETVFEFLGETYSDLLLPSMTFGVLVLFFLAIVKKS